MIQLKNDTDFNFVLNCSLSTETRGANFSFLFVSVLVWRRRKKSTMKFDFWLEEKMCRRLEKNSFFQTFIEDIFLVRKRQKRFLDKKTYFSDSLWQTFISNRLKSEKVESHFLSILKVLGASFFFGQCHFADGGFAPVQTLSAWSMGTYYDSKGLLWQPLR